MPTVDQIREQMKAVDAKKYRFHSEVDELQKMLYEHESILGVLKGNYQGNDGLLFATTHRIIFLCKQGLVFTKLMVKEFALHQISSINYEIGLIFSKVIIAVDGVQEVVDASEKSEIKIFRERCRDLLSQAKNQPASNANSPADDMISKLERLTELKKQGVLTDKEFEAQKLKLLNS